MKTNYNVILTLLLAFSVHFAFAQKTVSGTVSDESGALPGVSVLIKGTTTGTETDFDGNYAIQAKSGQTLQYSFIGMETTFRKVGTTDKIDVVMSGSEILDEVVITAMGVKREKKSLGYALTEVKSEDLQQKPEGDVSRVLQGKVAGVSIIPTGGLAGSGNSVSVRTKISIEGNNQPLYVIDGVPFSSNTDNNDDFTGFTGASTSSRSLDIDPNNIASMSILKGLSATVLYGSDGRNGVILITTKNGNTSDIDKKFEVTVSQTTSLNQISNLPEYQNIYGQGAGQNYNSGYVGNWGAKFDSDVLVPHNYDQSFITKYPEFEHYNGLEIPYLPVINNVKDFFRTGLGTSTSVNVSKGGKLANVNFNVGKTSETGFIPGNSLDRISLGLGGNAKLANKLNLNVTFNYVNTNFKAPPIASSASMAGYRSNLFTRLLFMPRNFDLMNLPYQANDGSSIYYREDQDNPRWLVDNVGSSQGVNRFFGKIGFNYDINDYFNISYVLGLDQYTEDATSFSNKGGKSEGLTEIGFLRNTSSNNQTIDQTILLTLKNIDLNESIGVNAVLGFNGKRYDYHQTGVLNENQIEFGFLHSENFEDASSIEYISAKNTLGVYSQVEMDFYKYLYLTLAGRQEWTSTTEKENKGIFYPSISASFLPTSAFSGIKSNFLNFLKIRGGYATTAGFPTPYHTRNYIELNSQTNGGSEGAISSQYIPNEISNKNLRPELHKEIEIGLEGKLLNSRIDFDISLYKRNSKDQILYVPSDPAVGGTYTYINAGDIQSEGLEVGLGVALIKNDNLTWKLNSNFTAYKSVVKNLPKGREEINIDGYTNLGNFAIEGEALGVIKGTYAIKDENGNYLINYVDGRLISNTDIQGNENLEKFPSTKIIGDPNPDWTATLINSFDYKGFSVGAQIEYTHGGDIFSQTASRLWRRGVTTANLDREHAVVIPGVLADPATGALVDTDGTPLPEGATPITNGIPITVNNAYFYNLEVDDAENIYDGSIIRLREVSISYKIEEKLLKNTPFGSMSFSLSGQNIWFNAFNFPKAFNFDPEVLSTGSGNGRGLEFQTAPTSKKYGFSIKATF